jgi:MFS family permease
MVQTSQWFIIYFSFTFAISTVLFFAGQLKVIAREFGIPPIHFDLILILFPLGNGISRIFGGVVSDWIGRERTMVVFNVLLSFSVFTLTVFGANPAVFVTLVFLCALRPLGRHRRRLLRAQARDHQLRDHPRGQGLGGLHLGLAQRFSGGPFGLVPASADRHRDVQARGSGHVPSPPVETSPEAGTHKLMGRRSSP